MCFVSSLALSVLMFASTMNYLVSNELALVSPLVGIVLPSRGTVG